MSVRYYCDRCDDHLPNGGFVQQITPKFSSEVYNSTTTTREYRYCKPCNDEFLRFLAQRIKRGIQMEQDDR